MIDDKISIRYFDKSQNLETIRWSLEGIDFVEQLIYNVLDYFGVKPIYKPIFGLRVTDKCVWLAPNLSKRDLLALARTLPGEHKFELRLRFRPSSYGKLLYLDQEAFELVFAQMRHDFLRTRFKSGEDFLQMDDAVLGLMGLEIWRYSIENNIEDEESIKRVNVSEFIPKRASRLQKKFLQHVADNIDLQKTVQMGYDICDKDIRKIKRSFIELFLNKVAQDYASEVYNVVQIINLGERSEVLELRVRYSQTDDESHCHIEVRPAPVKSTSFGRQPKVVESEWKEICDIETISRGTLRENIIQLSSHFTPVKYEFESTGHAQSFISCVDGYYRLMRKWNFNLCREITSPELEELRQMGCHGPIGYETSRIKLSGSHKTGTFLIRKCMEHRDRYLIDTILLKSNSRLIIDVDRDPKTALFRLVNHAVDSKIGVSVSTEREEYSSLKNLIDHTQIWVEDDDRSYPQQLKHWLLPDESDDYPVLLLSISKRKLLDFEQDTHVRSNNSLSELPRFIPQHMLTYHLSMEEGSKVAQSFHSIVKMARLNRDREVIVKTIRDNLVMRLDDINQLRFHLCPGSCRMKAQTLAKSPQLYDWLFVKHHVLAESIGLDMNNALIQEYFQHGPLDQFLQQNQIVSPIFKLSVSVQLAEVLLFLQERNVIHGKIRCHNIFVKQPHPIQVKLTDPLGPSRCDTDQAFIAPEYVGATGELCIKQFEPGIDVWALGTTLWQIYSDGIQPPANRFANTLLQPSACPDGVWSLLESCWTLNAKARASPQVILRDLNDMFAWEEGVHEYYYVQKQMDNSDDTNPQVPPSSPSINGGNSIVSDHSSSSQTATIRGDVSESSSQRILLKDRSSSKSRNRGISIRCNRSNRSILSISSGATNHLFDRKFARYQWRGLVDGLRGGSHNILSRTRNFSMKQFSSSKTDFSELSLDSCSTPSDSGITRETDILDIQSVSNSVDQCCWHVDSAKLRLGPEIGRGTSGVVIKGVLSQKEGDEKVVAVKRIDKSTSNVNSYNDFNDLKKEFDVLKQLNDKNIIKILGYVDESYMMLIFEYMPLGSLLSYIKNYHHNRLHTLPLRKYAQDIASGMAYLEMHRVVHRDLALRNILVENRNEVKICDFGLARKLEFEDHYSLKTERALPLKWYAPETLITWEFTHKSDVWSYGVVLWEIYSGGSSPQYSTGTYAPELAEALKHERLPMPRNCPKNMYNLMLQCWAFYPEDRESFSGIKRTVDKLRRDEIQIVCDDDDVF